MFLSIVTLGVFYRCQKNIQKGNVIFLISKIINKLENNKGRSHTMSDYINEIRFDTKQAEMFFAKRLAYTLGPVELKAMLKDKKVKLLDVRHKEDFDIEHIPEAISMPAVSLNGQLLELSKNDVHVVYCYNQQCHLASNAALFLAKNDYPVMELEGGFNVWKEDFKFEVTK